MAGARRLLLRSLRTEAPPALPAPGAPLLFPADPGKREYTGVTIRCRSPRISNSLGYFPTEPRERFGALRAWAPGGAIEAAEVGSSEGLRLFPHQRLFFVFFFVKADPTGHRLFRLSSLQRYVGSNRLIFVIFCLLFFSTKLRPLLLAPNCIAGASHLGGKTKRPRMLLPMASVRPPREKELLPRRGGLSTAGRKEQVFFGVFSLRVMRWGFTFGLNFCFPPSSRPPFHHLVACYLLLSEGSGH